MNMLLRILDRVKRDEHLVHLHCTTKGLRVSHRGKISSLDERTKRTGSPTLPLSPGTRRAVHEIDADDNQHKPNQQIHCKWLMQKQRAEENGDKRH